MSIDVEVQFAVDADGLPKPEEFVRWIEAALDGKREEAEVAVRIVAADESRWLNASYRGKDRPTNVLSFPVGLPDDVEVPLLGDVILCAQVAREEAAARGKPLTAHLAHLTVHGVLHLLGYDHLENGQAETMEALEVAILRRLGYPDPYDTDY
ncbi:MAG: rRNA maturation RNase YbeY [Gammaproteobacteria bacterium]